MCVYILCNIASVDVNTSFYKLRQKDRAYASKYKHHLEGKKKWGFLSQCDFFKSLIRHDHAILANNSKSSCATEPRKQFRLDNFQVRESSLNSQLKEQQLLHKIKKKTAVQKEGKK